MSKKRDLERFIKAQTGMYPTALAEIRAGRKQSHWMWFIFPQVQGLGLSETARYYAISGLEEANLYFSHPVLGRRLVEISEALITQQSNDAHKIFGSPDDLKLKSCMTLFSSFESSPVFNQVLIKFFEGKPDVKTLEILKIGP